jgi:hypothetical protein
VQQNTEAVGVVESLGVNGQKTTAQAVAATMSHSSGRKHYEP